MSRGLLHKHKVLNNIKIFENLDQANDCQSIIHVLERDAINSTYTINSANSTYRDRLKGLYMVARSSCLPVLPDPAWVLLSEICIPFSRSMYNQLCLDCVKPAKYQPVEKYQDTVEEIRI